MSKVEVNGASSHPLWQWLRTETTGSDVSWNFNKFLVDTQGNVVKRYPSAATPAVEADILHELEKIL